MYKVKVFIQDKELQYEFSTFWQVSLFVRIANFIVRLLWGDLTPRALDGAGRAATLSGLYNCQVCGVEKCSQPGICEGCLTPPTEAEVKSWGFEETPRQ